MERVWVALLMWLGNRGMHGRGTLITRNQSTNSTGMSGQPSTYCSWGEGNVEQWNFLFTVTVLRHFCVLDRRRSRVWIPFLLQEHLCFENTVSSFNWIVFEILQCDFLKYFQIEVSPSASWSKNINNLVLAPLGCIHSLSYYRDIRKMCWIIEVAAFKCLLSLGVKTNRRCGICLFVLVGYENGDRSGVTAD